MYKTFWNSPCFKANNVEIRTCEQTKNLKNIWSYFTQMV